MSRDHQSVTEILCRSWTSTIDRFAADRINLLSFPPPPPSPSLPLVLQTYTSAEPARTASGVVSRRVCRNLAINVESRRLRQNHERGEKRESEMMTSARKLDETDLKAVKRVLLCRRQAVTDRRTLARPDARILGLLEKFVVNGPRCARC